MNDLEKRISEYKNSFPEITEIVSAREVFWSNTHQHPYSEASKKIEFTNNDEIDASLRLQRFAPYIAVAFPETQESNGIIESELISAPKLQAQLADNYQMALPGRLMIKLDSHLPISGSIKARGGIYEVLRYAETLAVNAGLLSLDDDYAKLKTNQFRQFFSQYSLAVGSTGNLGLSIGIMGAKLGFKVVVHMSADARQWKKDLLRSKGVDVREYEDNYSYAVEQGRAEADKDPNCHFVDDESSVDLFMGYSVAAARLKQQMKDENIRVDSDHPLFVYLPCGVGGGPGGISFGLKLAFGDDAHCIFAEPTHAPAVLLGLGTGLHDKANALDFGLDGLTAADGLAVSRPSGLVCRVMEPLLSGIYTTEDNALYKLVKLVADSENLQLEPSAVAGLPARKLENKMGDATHIAWATGGNMVPDSIWQTYYDKGESEL
ncbi:UNVERIFIED_CONTAM: hypothetical protein GTU68_022740 [Idotea baltica]|nr:hypothetical protein [Idotea baltica]